MSTTLLHAWRRRADMQPTTDGPVPWFYGIAANLVRRHLRAADGAGMAMARMPATEAEPDPSEDVAARLDDARRLDRIAEVLRSFPERDQELFVLCVWQELSYEEAAAALGVPVGTVRFRLSLVHETGFGWRWGNPTAGAGMKRANPAAFVTGRRVDVMDDLLELDELRALAPSPPVRPLSPERLAARKETLMREVARTLDAEATPPGQAPAPRPTRRLRKIAAFVLVPAALLGGAIAYSTNANRSPEQLGNEITCFQAPSLSAPAAGGG